jgi:uncharacterized protein (TIGR03118 family)
MVKMGVHALAVGLSIAPVGLLLLSTALPAQQAQHYMQTNLVADTMGPAGAVDSNLVNPWGVSRSSGSPWWVSDNGTGVATLYGGAGNAIPLVVTIPAAVSGQTGTPTGQVFNGTTDFELAKGKPALFIFATADGTISGWNPNVKPTTAVIKVNTKSASVFKGLAEATVMDGEHGPTNYLYAADFRKGQVDVFDTNFHRVFFPNAFDDTRIPEGFAPFNVQNIGGNIYVAFAKQDSQKHDEIDGAGLGFVDVFSPTGRLLRRLQSGRFFNAPWGMAQAPSDFGAYSHDILIGQFGSGAILVFDPVTGSFKDSLRDAKNGSIKIDGLWSIAFGGGTTSGPSNTLFFTAGTDRQQHGLFGAITAIENVLGGDQ